MAGHHGRRVVGAEAAARLLRYGPNAVRTHRVSALAVLGRQLRSAVLGLLAATAVLSFFLGDSTQAIIIGVILVASIGLGFVNEYRAERASAALHSGVRHTAVVRRDGRFNKVDVTDLVPGDVIRLALGEVVPADVRLIEGQRSGVQREHPDRRVDRRGEVVRTGQPWRGAGGFDRSGLHGDHRQRGRRGRGRLRDGAPTRSSAASPPASVTRQPETAFPGRAAPLLLPVAVGGARP